MKFSFVFLKGIIFFHLKNTYLLESSVFCCVDQETEVSIYVCSHWDNTEVAEENSMTGPDKMLSYLEKCMLFNSCIIGHFK